MANPNQRKTYAASGFNKFFRRSIDSIDASTLNDVASQATAYTNDINFDQSQTSGSLGSVVQVGNVNIDGVQGRISVFEGSDEVVRIGELDG